MFSPMPRREIKLLSFHRPMLFANCRKKAKSRNTAKHTASDVRTARNVTNKLHQLFFVAIRAWKVRFDRDLRHRFPQCSWNGCRWTTVYCRFKKIGKTHVDMFSSGMPAMQEALFAGLACDSLPKETRNRLSTYVGHREI